MGMPESIDRLTAELVKTGAPSWRCQHAAMQLPRSWRRAAAGLARLLVLDLGDSLGAV